MSATVWAGRLDADDGILPRRSSKTVAGTRAVGRFGAGGVTRHDPDSRSARAGSCSGAMNWKIAARPALAAALAERGGLR